MKRGRPCLIFSINLSVFIKQNLGNVHISSEHTAMKRGLTSLVFGIDVSKHESLVCRDGLVTESLNLVHVLVTNRLEQFLVGLFLHLPPVVPGNDVG